MNKSNRLLKIPLRLFLNIKIHTVWRLQFLLVMLKTHIQKKYFLIIKPITYENPLMYSCSGCSSAAQMANYLAVQLDRMGIAEISVIADVGGNVNKLVHTTLSRRKIIAIDGCPMACSKASLGNHSLQPDNHFELPGFGVKKREHSDFNLQHANQALEIIKHTIILNYKNECSTLYNEEN